VIVLSAGSSLYSFVASHKDNNRSSMKNSDGLTGVRIGFGAFVFFIAFVMLSGFFVVAISGINDFFRVLGLPSFNSSIAPNRHYMVAAAVSIGFISAVLITKEAVKRSVVKDE
jgi:hypothetical protein